MQPAKKLNEWTIVFLIYADLRTTGTDLKDLTGNPESENDKIIRELKSLFNDILSSPHHPLVDILVIYNRVCLNAAEKENDVTYLFHAVPDAKNPDFKKQLCLLQTWQTNDFVKKPEELINAFRAITEKFTSKHWLLFTWDHGSVFGIFREEKKSGVPGFSENIKYEKIHETLTENVWIKRNKSYIRHWDTEDNPRLQQKMPTCKFVPPQEFPFRDILTNEEMAHLVMGWLPNQKLDVLIMMNCYMQNVNTAYALRNCVKYLVATEGVINEPGYNYASILRSICNKPETSPKKVAKQAVTSLSELMHNPVFKKNINEWAVFAIRLKEYFLVIDIVNDLAEILLKAMANNEEIRDKIYNTRLYFFPFDMGVSTCMVDLRNCILKLNRNLNIPELDAIQMRYRYLDKKIIVGKFIGKNLYTPAPSVKYPDNFAPGGIALYFPTEKDDIDSEVFHTFISENAASRSLFFSNTQWLKFICDYVSSL